MCKASKRVIGSALTMIAVSSPFVLVLGLNDQLVGAITTCGATSALAQDVMLGATGQCHPPAPCGGGAGCVPAPTSLVPVNTTVSVPSGWETTGGHCGFKRCLIFFYIPCGLPLTSGACP